MSEKRKVYIEETYAPYQYNVRDAKTCKLLGYTDRIGLLEADIENKWLEEPIEVDVVKVIECQPVNIVETKNKMKKE